MVNEELKAFCSFFAGWFGLAGGWLAAEALEECRRRFVVGVLGDEFAAEGFGEGGGGEALDGLLRGGEAGFDPVGEGEQVFDTADDFLLFGEWWEEDFQTQQDLLIQIYHC